jgi:hypothetical protein
MTNPMTLAIPLAIGVLAALAAAALRTAANRRGPHGVPGAGSAPVPVTADQRQPRPAATAGTHHTGVPHMARPPRTQGQPARAIEQARQIFHELHADGRNALCVVCENRYEPA